MKNIKFLKELQEELRTQPTDSQAGPRFWTIRDYEWIHGPEYSYDRVSIYFRDDCHITTLDEYIDEVVSLETEYEYTKEEIQELKEAEDLFDKERWIKKYDTEEIEMIYEVRVPKIADNTMFLTKEEAKEHIKLNKHHYSEDAHTYAMTAWRAPKVAKLLDILENFDWNKVNINE